MLVKDFMTPNVLTISEDKSMLEARELMKSSAFRRIPVVDDIKRVMGIITDGDVGRTSPSDASTLSRYEANYLLSRLKVRDVMTRDVITVRDNSAIEDVAYILYKHKINALPVVNEDNRLCGIITDSDISVLSLPSWALLKAALVSRSMLLIRSALLPILAVCSAIRASISFLL